MITLLNVPDAVYLVALDYMGADRPADPTNGRAIYDSAVQRVDYQPIVARQMGRDVSPISALGLAVAQYVSSTGPFSENNGEFHLMSGYELR